MNYLITLYGNDHKYKMIAKILWPLIQVNLPLMFYNNEIPMSSHYKKGFMILFTVTLRSFVKYHSPPCFPSRTITKNAETHPTPMRGVIIERPLFCEYSYLKAANSFEESSIIDNWLSSKFAFRHFHSVLNFAVWQENYENRNKYLKFVVWFLNDYKFVIFFAMEF